MSIFCVATIIFQHCLNPLGHGVHQSFTGCHWSPLSLLHDDITELVDVKDLALFQLPFEDAPQITFTLSFFSKAVVILEVWLGSLIMLERVPVAQWLEHCVSSSKVVGSIPREHMYWQYKCIAWMHCKSLWIKASAKCINVNGILPCGPVSKGRGSCSASVCCSTCWH